MSRPELFRDLELDVSGEIIGFYPREFYVFDNFAAFQVDYRGRRWATSEHAYQAAKFLDTAPEISDLIFVARSPHDAKVIARANRDKGLENWGEVKVNVMYEICKLKLQQNSYVWEKLEMSNEGMLEIVEDSPKDAYWGWGPSRDGENQLGKVWMRLRAEQASGDIEPSFES